MFVAIVVGILKSIFFVGSTALKVNAGAGDLVLWDSRTVHCNTPPVPVGGRITSNQYSIRRLVAYVCMVPRSLMKEEEVSMQIHTLHFRTGVGRVPEWVLGWFMFVLLMWLLGS